MASSTLLYIAWPLTLGLSFIAGSIDLSNETTIEKSKGGNQPLKVSRTKSSSNSSRNENSPATNRRSSATRFSAGKDGSAESYDIKEITNISDPQKRLSKLLRMIDQLGPGDFEQLVSDFRGLGIDEFGLFLSAWAKINPEGALAYTEENIKASFQSHTARVSILSTWAAYAPDAAIQWAKLNHDGDKANPYLEHIIIGIAQTNLERATDMLQDLPLNRASRYPLHAILGQVSKLDSEKAIAWLATIENEKLNATATARLTSILAKKDPQATASWLETLSADTLKASAGIVAREWAAQDIDKAAEWTSSLKGETRTHTASMMMRQFVSSDPKKAATWMKTMSGEPYYKNLVRSFVNSAQADHPELALAHLDQIGDTHGQYTKHYTLAQWAAKDKGAATQWMQSNSIDAAAQKRVLSTAARIPGAHR